MKSARRYRIWVIISLFVSPMTSRAADPHAEQLFVRRIAPLLAEKCVGCHGRDKTEGGLDLGSRLSAMRGGDSGVATIVESRPEESPLLLAVSRSDANWSAMPPKEADQLSTEQIGWLKSWIAEGAPWPDVARQKQIALANSERWSREDGTTVNTSGGQSAEWSNRRYLPGSLWGYQPVRKPDLAVTKRDHPVPHPIDLLLARTMTAGLENAAAADARTLIRRATFDLTGLPPTPDEVTEFETASMYDADAAFEMLINRLLGSPHYGERMAQHWFDVTRYADSSGFSNDYERGNAWRYRDYVVRAFNRDLPYDQFVRDQIAGDEIAPQDPEKIIATGFLRMGPWELTGMEVEKIARQRFLDDVVNSVGETFLAHSLQCARCHDHKFDPVPTRDYYSIQAVFSTTQLAERAAPFLPSENITGFEERIYLERARAAHQLTLSQLDLVLLENAGRWFVQNGRDPTAWNAAVETARSQAAADNDVAAWRRPYSDLFATARKQLAEQNVPESEFPPKLVGLTAQQFGQERVARKGLERLRWEMDRYEPYALAVYSGRTRTFKSVSAPLRMPDNRMTQGEIEGTCILAGGDPFSNGQKVSPSVLSAVKCTPEIMIPDDISGRRKAFAEWVASPANPLATRTIVNRIWMWHFDQPIAGNPNNFGSTGKRPTHPKLLDWLAATFVEHGWSIKSMHRLIMTSAAYRRSSTHPDWKSLQDKDPLGTSYAVFKPRRLTAEELRDAMLSVSGELNRQLGGIPARPEINLEAALQPRQVMGTFAAAWVPHPSPAQRHRRTLYVLKLRGLSDPAMEVFNAPTPDFSCEHRDASTVTPQVFALFNSRTSQARALAFAARVRKEASGDEDAIRRCFQLAFGRPANQEEIAACLSHWHEMKQVQAKLKPPPAPPPREVRREAIEENTGERFSFLENLYSNADFIPDLQPADCDASTRALADVCLVLLNANEFAYVY